MAKKSDAKRAAKKHDKAKKRQKKLAARAAPGLDPIARWRPAEHGVEGLARLFKTDTHHAAVVADLLAAEGHPGAADTWHPARVRTLGPEGILAGLAERGVVTDEPSFTALTTKHDSARRLAAEAWHPALPAEATVHDRDFLAEAAEQLWQRWTPDRLSDEALADRAAVVFTNWEDRASDTFVADFLALWTAVRDVGGLARIDRAVGSREGFVASFLDALEAYDTDDTLPAFDADAAATMLRELRADTPPGTQMWTGITLRLARVLVDHGHDVAAIDDLLACATTHPALLALPMEAVELYGGLPDDPPGLYDRVATAVNASRTIGPPKFRDLGGALLAYLDTLREKKHAALES